MQRSRKQCFDVAGGDTVDYDVVDDDGYRMCRFRFEADEAQAHFDSIGSLQCREDDILLCSYPKTGTNWLWEMVYLVLKRQSKVTADNKMSGMLEARHLEVIGEVPSPRILNTHIKVKYLPKEAKEKKLKTILVARNPKDVAVSFYNHTKGIRIYNYTGKFENYLAMFMRGEVDYGSYPQYLLEWQEFIKNTPEWPIHIVYYEDLKEDGFNEMKKICEFLKQDISDELLADIVENCTADKMRKGKDEVTPEHVKAIMANVFRSDFNTIRKGQIGDWKNWFTVARSEAFDEWWKQEAKDIDLFKFRYY